MVLKSAETFDVREHGVSYHVDSGPEKGDIGLGKRVFLKE
jgi:hypothetical protein